MFRKTMAFVTILLSFFATGLFGEEFFPPESSPKQREYVLEVDVSPETDFPRPAAPKKMDFSQPLVFPEEIDLGVIRPGEEVKGIFFTKSGESATPVWFARAPAGWESVENQNITGLTGETPEPFLITLRYVKEVERFKNSFASLVLSLESGGRKVAFRREAPVGELREMIKFNYVGGTQTASFVILLEKMPIEPILGIDERRIDLGVASAGETISRRIMLTNKGKEPLEWKIRIAGAAKETIKERYFSFRRDDQPATSAALAGFIKTGLELLGGCACDNQGYPSCEGEDSLLRFKFTGTGLKLYFRKSLEGGLFKVFLGEEFIELFDSYSTMTESAEVFLVEGKPYGDHVLTIYGGQGRTTFEGAGILGEKISQGPRGWISVFPDSGTTTRETDYINVSVNTRGLPAGFYCERILFTSNGGSADSRLSLEVTKGSKSSPLNIHRYFTGFDSLFTVNPQTETARVKAKGYQYSGVAFRLFAPGTPGTTEFFRWFNPVRGDHYYTHERDCSKALPGYLFEGSIGNIGTSKLKGTRALYRWYNSKTGCHFYTTEPNSEGMAQKGYYFDGIAGYVQ
jgi:hypothetical protein